MRAVGQVESLWRYPVKSMRGEQLQEARVDFPGIHGDRLYGFHNTGAPSDFPYLTAREQAAMLLYRPAYRGPSTVEVETPAGKVFAIDDPELIALLREGLRESFHVTLLRSDQPMTDCHPISLFSRQTAQQLSREIGFEIDQRRFRANVYIDLASRQGFGEDDFVGRSLRIGKTAVVTVLKRDARCKMITLDPETAEASPDLMKAVARSHDGKAGVYAAVVTEGTIHPGDEISLC